MNKLHKYCILSMLVGIIIFLLSITFNIVWLGVSGYFITISGLICLMFSTKTGMAIFISGGIFTILGLLIYFGPVQLVKETGNLIFILNNKNSVIEIDATVTDIIEKVDGDGGTDYAAYVSYSYNDKTYDNHFWKYVDNNCTIGSKAKIKILPQKPDDIFDGTTHHLILVIWSFVVTVFLVIAVASLLSLLKKKLASG